MESITHNLRQSVVLCMMALSIPLESGCQRTAPSDPDATLESEDDKSEATASGESSNSHTTSDETTVEPDETEDVPGTMTTDTTTDETTFPSWNQGIDGYCPKDGRAVVYLNAQAQRGASQIDLGEPSGWLACIDDAPFSADYVANLPSFFRLHAVPCETEGIQTHECMSDSDCIPEEACICHGWAQADESSWWLEFLSRLGGDAYQFGGISNLCLPNFCKDGCNGHGCSISVDLCGKPQGIFCHTDQDECRMNDDCFLKDNRRSHCSYVQDHGRWRCIGKADCD